MLTDRDPVVIFHALGALIYSKFQLFPEGCASSHESNLESLGYKARGSFAMAGLSLSCNLWLSYAINLLFIPLRSLPPVGRFVGQKEAKRIIF